MTCDHFCHTPLQYKTVLSSCIKMVECFFMCGADDHTCTRLLLVENTVIMENLFILFKMLLGSHMDDSFTILQ